MKCLPTPFHRKISPNSRTRGPISARAGRLVGHTRGPQVGTASIGRRVTHHWLPHREEGQVQPALGEGSGDAHAYTLRYC